MGPTERRAGSKEMLALLTQVCEGQDRAASDREFMKSQMLRVCSDIEGEKDARERMNSSLMGEIRRLRIAMDGDDSGKPGIKGRVQRLEDTDHSRTWHMRAVWGAVLASFGAWLFGGHKS